MPSIIVPANIPDFEAIFKEEAKVWSGFVSPATDDDGLGGVTMAQFHLRSGFHLSVYFMLINCHFQPPVVPKLCLALVGEEPTLRRLITDSGSKAVTLNRAERPAATD